MFRGFVLVVDTSKTAHDDFILKDCGNSMGIEHHKIAAKICSEYPQTERIHIRTCGF